MRNITIAEVQQGVVDTMLDEARIDAELTVLMLLRAGCEDDEITAYVRLMDKEPS